MRAPARRLAAFLPARNRARRGGTTGARRSGAGTRVCVGAEGTNRARSDRKPAFEPGEDSRGRRRASSGARSRSRIGGHSRQSRRAAVSTERLKRSGKGLARGGQVAARSGDDAAQSGEFAGGQWRIPGSSVSLRGGRPKRAFIRG